MTKFAAAINNLRTSEIRDLMKLATKPGIISFAGGMPGNDLFPLDTVEQIFKNLNLSEKQMAMQYGPTPGLPPLIESLSDFLRKKGFPVDSNKLMITTGSLQAINILAKAFVDPGDNVIVENPCFIGAISAFKSYQANILGVPLQSDGISVEGLKAILNENNKKPGFVYLTPNFHNPAGILYDARVKHEVIDLLSGMDIPLIEDDVYSDLYFYEEDKENLKSIKVVDPKGLEVCYAGSFSKILGPGLRLGWMLVPPNIYQKCELIKQSIDACSPSFTQVLADKFIRSGAIYSYMAFAREEYKKRAEAMVASLEKYLPEYVKWSRPRGGFYIWLELPEHTDTTEILKKAVERGAVFVTGKTFDPNGKINNNMRISYCNTSIEMIHKGIPVVADAIRDVCG